MTNIKIKLNLTKDYPNCNLDSIINAPILKNEKVIGVITNYNLNTDEASGYIYDNITPTFLQDNIVSMEIVNNEK